MKHPTKFVRECCEAIRDSGRPIRRICADAGVSYATFYRWERGIPPRLDNFVAVLNECGLTLVSAPVDDPPS